MDWTQPPREKRRRPSTRTTRGRDPRGSSGTGRSKRRRKSKWVTQLPMANKWKEAPPEECLWVSSEAIITSTFRFVIVHRVWRNGNLFPSSPSSYSPCQQNGQSNCLSLIDSLQQKKNGRKTSSGSLLLLPMGDLPADKEPIVGGVSLPLKERRPPPLGHSKRRDKQRARPGAPLASSEWVPQRPLGTLGASPGGCRRNTN